MYTPYSWLIDILLKDSSAVSKQWAWPNVPNLQGPAMCISGSTIESIAIEDEKGDINKSEVRTYEY